MSDTEITPEVLREVANWIDGCGHGLQPGHALREEADRIERAQDDEQRIDELAAAYLEAYLEAAGNTRASQESSIRAGIRAILAKLDEEQDAEMRAAFGDEQCTPIRVPVGYGDPGADPAEEWDRKPRQWNDLRDIPNDVQLVFTFEGETRRNGSTPNGWRWTNGQNVSDYGLTAHAPYIEISGSVA